MKSARYLSVLAAALLLNACMLLGPDYQRPASTLPAAFPDAANAAARPDTLAADWWTLFRDPTLNDLVQSALANNTDVRRAIARIEETDANLRAAGAAFLPEVDVSSSATRSAVSTRTAVPIPGTVPTVRNDLRLGLSSSFELDFWGRLRRGVEAARAQALSSRYAKDVVMLSLASLTTQAYFVLRSLDAQIATTRATLASREESLSLVRRRADAGLASDLELSQATGARADAATQLSELTRQRALAAHQLATLTGKLDLELAAGDLRALPQPALPPAGLPSALIERRPDIRQAEQDLIAANAKIGVARAAMLPTISLTGSFGAQSAALGSLFEGPARIWSIGPTLTAPLFDAGKYAALARAEQARATQTVENYRKSIETAFREVADALTNVRQLAASETDMQTSITAARESLRLANLRYDAGYAGYLEVLDAQRTLNLTELALVRNRQALLSADVDLMRALGGGWYAQPQAAAR